MLSLTTGGPHSGYPSVMVYFLNLTFVSPNRPNVCPEREVKLVAQKQPCVQAFSRMVKVWKQGCVGQSWCMRYERRYDLSL